MESPEHLPPQPLGTHSLSSVLALGPNAVVRANETVTPPLLLRGSEQASHPL
jgi:hypothetical protein